MFPLFGARCAHFPHSFLLHFGYLDGQQFFVAYSLVLNTTYTYRSTALGVSSYKGDYVVEVLVKIGVSFLLHD